MKRYTDLSLEELEVLDEAGIQRLVDIEVACAGIQMVPKPLPLELVTEVLQPTETAYECKGVLVGTMEDAQVIQALTVLRENYHGGDWDHRYLEPRDHDSEIKIRKFYTKEAAAALKPKAEANKAAKKEFEAANKLYCEYEQQIDGFKQEVLEAVQNARQVMYARRQAQAAYEHYVDLADNNTEVADKFFRDAFKGQHDLLNFVLGVPLPTLAEEADDAAVPES